MVFERAFSPIRQGPLVRGLGLLCCALFLAGCQKDPATLDTPVKVYETYCFACHNSGAANAPRLHDTERWQLLLAAGEDKLIENTLKGIRAMPARGSCSRCTDEQLIETVRWMLSQNGLL